MIDSWTDRRVVEMNATIYCTSPETDKRCDGVKLSAKDAKDYSPVKMSLFNLLTGEENLRFPIYVAMGWDLVEFIRPVEYSKDLLWQIRSDVKNGACKVVVQKKHYALFEAMVAENLKRRFAQFQKKCPKVSNEFCEAYIGLFLASGYAVRGGLDSESAFRINRAASEIVTNGLDLNISLRLLLIIATYSPSLYDHSAFSAMIAALISSQHPTSNVPKAESKIIAQAALLHDIDKTCHKSKKDETTKRESLGLRELQALIEEGASIHSTVPKILKQSHERFEGSGPMGLSGREEGGERGICNGALYLTPSCYIARAMRRSTKESPLKISELINALNEKVGSYFDPEVFGPVVETLNSRKKAS